MPRIVIVDLGTGNLRSVSQALAHVAADADITISAEPAIIESAEHLVLPGQGALGVWMARLNASTPLRSAVSARLRSGPVLGICLGLQALYTASEENGGTPGLGLLDGMARHFAGAMAGGKKSAADGALKIPHMGWNRVRQIGAHPLWHGIADQQRFYFAHSYFVHSASGDEVVGECEHGIVFAAAAARDNLFATQFHPEKSQRAGLQLLKNFVNWNGVI